MRYLSYKFSDRRTDEIPLRYSIHHTASEGETLAKIRHLVSSSSFALKVTANYQKKCPAVVRG